MTHSTSKVLFFYSLFIPISNFNSESTIYDTYLRTVGSKVPTPDSNLGYASWKNEDKLFEVVALSKSPS